MKKNRLHFRVPKNYFDQMEQEILEQTVNARKSKVVPLYKKHWVEIAVAAAVVLLALMVFNLPQPTPTYTEEEMLSTENEVLNLYLNESDDYSTDDYAEVDVYAEFVDYEY